jgi:hypothetical protein
MTLGRCATAEAIGTGLLLAVVVGSGIMGDWLAQGNTAVALLANAVAAAPFTQWLLGGKTVASPQP